MNINFDYKSNTNYNFSKIQTIKQKLSSIYAEKNYGYYNKLFAEEIKEKNNLRRKKY